jgi:hypothetical protein
MNKVLNFLEGYNPNLINVRKYGNQNSVEGYYKLSLKRNNRLVSFLTFELSKNNENKLHIKIVHGETPNDKYKSQGYGTLLRALATKAGQIAGAKYARQNGLNVGNRSVKRLQKNPKAIARPTSSFIMSRLGWKEINDPEAWRNGVPSRFNYNSNNMSKVNAYLRNNRFRAVPSSESLAPANSNSK